MTAAAKSLNPANRKSLLAKVHMGAKDLGLDEATRRDLLERVTTHRSAGDCDDGDLVAVLSEYRRLGWKPATPQQQMARNITRAAQASHPVAKKARALWISLHQLGVVRDPSEKALEAFCRRQLKVDRLHWADQAQSEPMIRALKAMAERAGWSQDLAGIKPERRIWSLKARLVNAQLETLGRPSMMGIGKLSEAELDATAKALAKDIWAADRVQKPEARD